MAKQDDYIRYTIRVPADLYEQLRASAGDKSINAEVIARLARSYEAPRSRPDVTVVLQALPAGSEPIEVSVGQFLQDFAHLLRAHSSREAEAGSEAKPSADRTLLPPIEEEEEE